MYLYVLIHGYVERQYVAFAIMMHIPLATRFKTLETAGINQLMITCRHVSEYLCRNKAAFILIYTCAED